MVSFITEKQFNMLHDLLNLCDEKQIPREMQYIIAKNLQSSLYMERDIEEIKNELLSDSVPFAKDNPCKICLFTDGEVYGPMPEEDEPLLQRISLTDKGNVTVTFYNYEKKKLGMKKFRVDADRALAVIRDIAYHFACEPTHLRAYDVGSWDLTITTDRDEKYDFCGDLIEDAVQNTLSDKLRDLLNDPALLCFDGRDGKKRKYRICFCRFESGDKEYSYRSDNPDIHVGDAVIVPVGNWGRTAFATVTNIEYIDEDELALPLDEIKFIERALTLADQTGKGNVTLFDVVKRAVDATDCEGFLETGCPADEYDGESRLIAQRIAPHMDKYQIATIMAEVMTNQMGTPYPSNMFYNAAEYIIKAITDEKSPARIDNAKEEGKNE